MPATIYTLTNPINNQVYYVGQTILSLRERFSGHMCWNKPTTCLLKSIGLKPIMEVVETCSFSEVDAAEDFWIHQFIAWGFKLENVVISKNQSLFPARSRITVALTRKEQTSLKRFLAVRGNAKLLADKCDLFPQTIRNVASIGRGEHFTIEKLRNTVLN